MNVRQAIIYGTRSKSQGEVTAHCLTRAAFLRLVAADPRVRALFAQWRRESKLDLVVTEWSALLDSEAARLGLPQRAALHHDAAVYDAIPPASRLFFAQCELLRQGRTARSLDARAGHALQFVSTVLYDNPPPIRGWLGTDLLRMFDAEIVRDVWGEADVQMDVSAGTLQAVPPGQRPKRQGEHLERNAEWNYRARVAAPKVSVETLASEYRKASDVLLQPRDIAGISDRPDTKLVRWGIHEAQRLLELTIPPEQWAQYAGF